jgi:hypothetical protein
MRHLVAFTSETRPSESIDYAVTKHIGADLMLPGIVMPTNANR